MGSFEDWLDAIGMAKYAGILRDNDVDLDTLPDLTDADLRDLGISLGDRKRLLRAAAGLRTITAVDVLAEPRAEGAPALDKALDGRSIIPRSQPGERRHLTVLFCDLIGSSALSEDLEAEDLVDVLQRYRDACGKAIASLEGAILRFLGDGILACFGHPVAHEDDAERAVRASLDIVRAMRTIELPDGSAPRVRIGIATGPVLVGELFQHHAEEANAIVGVTPNLAARLQSLAPFDGIIIADATRRLVVKRFECRDFGLQSLRGFRVPARVWQVTGEIEHRSRVQRARLGGTLSQMVNRLPERAQLRSVWETCLAGQGRVIVIAGEAGIGKSRLVAHFLSMIEDEGAVIRRLLCSSFTTNSPLAPLIAYIAASANIRDRDPVPVKLRKLQRLATGTDVQRDEVLEVFATLLSLSKPDSDPDVGRAELEPRQVRAVTRRVLVDQFLRLTDDGPLVGVVEDLHWLDPTTADVLDALIGRIANHRILLLLTCREEALPAWRDRPGVEILRLGRLPPEEAAELVRNVLGTSSMTAAIAEQIVRKTDGVPLFIEEFTKTIVETAPAPASSGGGQAAATAVLIPLTLHDSLLARLDRAGPGKYLAQVGAVIGRSITRELLEAVAELPPDQLDDGCETLLSAGIFLRDGDASDAYVFKHALVQDTAYDSLVRHRRVALHARVADALITLKPALIVAQPELLAHQLTAADRPQEAVPWWLRAGRHALERSAVMEAAIHLRSGLKALDRLPATLENRETRLEFMVLLGPALISVMGPGTQEVEQLYAEAVELCQALPDSPRHFAVFWGWWRLSRDFRIMRDRATALHAHARARDESGLLLQAHHCQWASHFNAGDFTGSNAHIEDGLGIYTPEDHRHHASLYGNHDAKVCAHGERSLVLWMLGRPDEALAEERVCLAWAGELDHAGSLGHSMDIALAHGFYRRDPNAVMARAERYLRFAEERGFSDHEAKGMIFRGWATAKLGDTQRGLADVRAGLLRQKEIGTSEDFPLYVCMLGETLGLANRLDEAHGAVLEGRQEAERTGLAVWLPELIRWEAEILRLGGDRGDAVEAGYRAAIVVAQGQQARALELRASVGLAQLLNDRGDRPAALAQVATALALIKGGRDTSDIKEALSLQRRFHNAET
ncbi:MAG TPA: adenylate/guanylate cyclase domain-containing protein [Stellaceae bacterium]|nr:adenylate/guanylate cyclase domain-containing protein [Stellaceae bacterium]